MKGFSNRWKDFPDYIIGITKEIWEDRGVGTLARLLRQRHRRALAHGHPAREWGCHGRNDGDDQRISRPRIAWR